MNELSVASPYKEMLEKYEKEDTPILSRGLTIDVKSDIEDGCYVINHCNIISCIIFSHRICFIKIIFISINEIIITFS